NNHIVFAIIENNLPVGVVSINNIDLKNKKADWAYYLSENSRNGLGSFIEYNLINFIFDELKLEKLNCEVISENSSVCKLHNKFYFKEEGCKESNILRDNKRIDIILFGLKKEDWLQKKDKLFKRYSRLFNNFSIEFFYKHNIEEKKPLDLIEEARAKNNVNWMNVLRLVLELSPKNGGEIVKSIRELDKEILKLTDKLLSND
ncbi:GNAT family N-acetyltransferase, partial [Allofrancisella guangzhouensis]|uniref:GNAT family N-acetyltransferase n=3 Tax=Pseudomonadota TaxID=1224 RepID=UPI0019082CC1